MLKPGQIQTTAKPIKNENPFDNRKAFSEKKSMEDTQLSVVTIEGNTLEQVATAKLSGLELDSELCFYSHVDKLCRKLGHTLSNGAILNIILDFMAASCFRNPTK